MNYEIKIDVTKIDKTALFKGQKGTYLTLDVIETPNGKYGTHMVKQHYDKDAYNALSDEQKKNIPILGNMVESKFQKQSTPAQQAPTPVQAEVVPNTATDGSDQLPF